MLAYHVADHFVARKVAGEKIFLFLATYSAKKRIGKPMLWQQDSAGFCYVFWCATCDS
jgi:hypothetical protein